MRLVVIKPGAMIFELHLLSKVAREDTIVTNNNNQFINLGV